jgi:hypothetical protein
MAKRENSLYKQIHNDIQMHQPGYDVLQGCAGV